MTFLTPSMNELEAIGGRMIKAQVVMDQAFQDFLKQAGDCSNFDMSVLGSLHDIQKNVAGLACFLKNPVNLRSPSAPMKTAAYLEKILDAFEKLGEDMADPKVRALLPKGSVELYATMLKVTGDIQLHQLEIPFLLDRMFPKTAKTYRRFQNLSKNAPRKLRKFKKSVGLGSFFSWRKSPTAKKKAPVGPPSERKSRENIVLTSLGRR